MDPQAQRALEIMAAIRHDAMLVQPDAWDTDFARSDATTHATDFGVDDRCYRELTLTPYCPRRVVRSGAAPRLAPRRASTWASEWLKTGAGVAVWFAIGLFAAAACPTLDAGDGGVSGRSVATSGVTSSAH